MVTGMASSNTYRVFRWQSVGSVLMSKMRNQRQKENGSVGSRKIGGNMRIRIVCFVFFVLLAAGCTDSVVTPPVEPALEVIEEDQGWVRVEVTGVAKLGYEIHWGDVDTAYGVSLVLAEEETYYHFYQAEEGPSSGEQIPRDYDIVLIDDEGHEVDQESVHVESVDCYLALMEKEGRDITVRYWGRFGIDYSISWGDGQAHHLKIDMQLGTGLLTHEYDEAGTYTLGMEEIWAPAQPFFTVNIE